MGRDGAVLVEGEGGRERAMSQSPYEPRRVERRRLKPPGGPLSGRSGPYSLAQGERERDMSDEQKCPMCGGPMVESHSPSGFLSRHWVDGDACLRRQLAHALERAEKAEARVKELETLLDVFCGLQIPELRAEVERLREALQLILPMAKGYARAHPVGSNQKYIEEAEALAASEAQEGAKA